ncbi:ExbD/TolR family protein [Celeribacter neptunius]|uniref:Outer membrane transport energization protein ExbD (TC 2.C.1.1.1) n=1 Tax=Celeribacter neptunius TaxID=588602 RepID=A0A1I3TGM1_9RHOB|nr:biopolymer transporter ExbD [Celeribacter neptunius]SFJ69663.1 outer membrane transport energization protein ExbD (TC 2.C.1.1.1) [Celeribacter neptunius]
MRKPRRRRRLSMTSLIDVIFLLLLFFMLTSTFSRFSEVELAASGPGAAPTEAQTPPIFVQLSPEQITLNARETTLETLPIRLRADRATDETVTVILALKGAVTAQRLTDLLVTLRGIDGVRPVILGAT